MQQIRAEYCEMLLIWQLWPFVCEAQQNGFCLPIWILTVRIVFIAQQVTSMNKHVKALW